jgi:hypothetical protein
MAVDTDRWLEMDLTWFNSDAELSPQIDTLTPKTITTSVQPSLARSAHEWAWSVIRRRP